MAERHLERAVPAASRLLERLRPSGPPFLSTQCADCPHTYNWHASASRCTGKACRCSTFRMEDQP